MFRKLPRRSRERLVDPEARGNEERCLVGIGLKGRLAGMYWKQGNDVVGLRTISKTLDL